MRPFALLTCALLLSGCAGGADAALTAQDAKTKLAVKDRAFTQLATTEMQVITTAAASWMATNGTMTGFAADLQATNPAAAANAVILTDAQASVQVSPGHCLTVALPSGQPMATAC